MSITNFPGSANSSPLDSSITKVTIPALAEMKRQGKPISALTAYDYATSRLVDEAGIDLVRHQFKMLGSDTPPILAQVIRFQIL